MTISGRVVRSSPAVRGWVAAGLVVVWVTVFVLLLQVAVSSSILWTLPFGVALAALMGLLVFATDGSTRRRQAAVAGWRGDPDVLAVVQVDADQGVLPGTEPQRELAYRYAVRVWRRRGSAWFGAVVVSLVQLGATTVGIAFGGWPGGTATAAYLLLVWIAVHRVVVVLPRLRGIIRTVEGR